MKINKVFIALTVFCLVLIVGCSNKLINEGNKIIVEKRVSEANEYEPFNEINDKEKVQNVKDILDKIKWKNIDVDMVRPADYIFYFKDSNEISEAKGLTYNLWKSPNKDKIEISIDFESKYIQLDKEKSEELFQIIVGKSLSEIK
ncbi:hypothetical protein JYG23_07910 [Sedimentibacter sp. zth1]|uniref:hypothetical protein n=1 Tax=Sedimentibacter sp. zth1 TaxID=2816908 RepID=UPI001A921F28|nr:hypothetical protein [Sedimentibacter sp. zth1]QSX07256.1 hypothetical protein JYG23_07910 [Sedimentibacter sp. zth1]